jgi:DNA mismatch endonuclease (patch repair protein)
MADVHSRATRSFNMSRIRCRDTEPEEVVRRYLFSRGLRYRKNDKRYPGHPDVVLPKYHTLIFVNGCFWHMHEGCQFFVMPKSNTDYWIPKLNDNRQRDLDIQERLLQMGWKVIVVWECELKPKRREETLRHLYDDIVHGPKFGKSAT